MRLIQPDYFNTLVQAGGVKPRLRRELRFGASTADIPPAVWAEIELVRVSDRSGNQGVLLLELATGLFVLPYELSGTLADPRTGRSKPAICDLCTTWQAGGNAAPISFGNVTTGNNHTVLVCADLKCSLHVRNQTNESRISRTQLHEDLTVEQRVNRLKDKLVKLTDTLGLTPADTPLLTDGPA